MKKLVQWLFLVIALFAAGCGGGDGDGGANGDVAVFVTDDLNTFYEAVWVTMLRVELQSQGGGFVTIFNDPNGKVVNLRALNDGSPRYAFLGVDRVPEGVYTGMRFTLDKDVRITAAGGGSAQARVFDPPFINPSNPEQAILTLTFGAPKTIVGTSNDIVADFVLASWTENGAQIQNAILAEGTGTGLGDNARHDEDKFHGQIAGLSGTSPNFTFTLNLESENRVTVTTDSMTSVFNNNGSPNPQLANGKRVEVRGKWDVATRTVVATSVKIKASTDNDTEDSVEANGIAVDIDEPTGTFDVDLTEVEGYLPTQPVVHVATSSSTLYFDSSGVLITRSDFFENIIAGDVRVEVEGTWEIATNTITAFKAKIEDDGSADHSVQAVGSANTISAIDGTFRIQLAQWAGFAASAGTQVNIVTNGSTSFQNASGATVTQAEFFVLLAASTSVRAHGAYNNGTIVADFVRIRDLAVGQAEAYGEVNNINSGSQTFDLEVIIWSGFNVNAGQTIQVAMSGTAVFRDASGNKMSAVDFFNEISAGAEVSMRGTFDAGTTTFTATEVKIER